MDDGSWTALERTRVRSEREMLGAGALRRLTKRALRRSGFTVFRPGKLPVGSDYRVALAMAGLAPSTVIDVGANVGQFSQHCAEFFPAATIHALEPIAYTFAQLVHNVAGNDRIHRHELACAAEAGEAEVFLQSQFVTNTLDPGQNVQSVPDQPRQVGRMARLDDFCEELGLEQVHLLKVDVEGFDLEVLRGAQRMFDNRSVTTVLVEVTFDQEQLAVSQFGPISDFLVANGFALSGFYNQTTRGAGRRPAFADALFACQVQ